MTPGVYRAKRVTAAVRAVELPLPPPLPPASVPSSSLCARFAYLPTYPTPDQRRYGSHVLDRRRRRRFAVWNKPFSRYARSSLNLSSAACVPAFLLLADAPPSKTQSRGPVALVERMQTACFVEFDFSFSFFFFIRLKFHREKILHSRGLVQFEVDSMMFCPGKHVAFVLLVSCLSSRGKRNLNCI